MNQKDYKRVYPNRVPFEIFYHPERWSTESTSYRVAMVAILSKVPSHSALKVDGFASIQPLRDIFNTLPKGDILITALHKTLTKSLEAAMRKAKDPRHNITTRGVQAAVSSAIAEVQREVSLR